jgi:hypothetical protein
MELVQNKINQGFRRVQPTPRGIETCACTTRFRPDTSGQKKCRECDFKVNRARFEARRVIAEKTRALNKQVSEKSAFAKSVEAQWYAGKLPADAKETINGRQVVIFTAGRSVTFYKK